MVAFLVVRHQQKLTMEMHQKVLFAAAAVLVAVRVLDARSRAAQQLLQQQQQCARVESAAAEQ